MSEKRAQTSGNRSAAIAAIAILLFAGLGFIVMPPIMLSLGEISPWLAAAVAVAFTLAFFAIFWLRARYQRSRSGLDGRDES